MNAKVYFATVLMLGLTAPKIYCAEQPQVNSGRQLIESIQNRDFAKAKQLIVAGADVNYTEGGRMPLFMALVLGADVELIQMLVYHKANVRAKGGEGSEAFHFLIMHPENFQILGDILLRAGANIDATEASNGFTPLHFAAGTGNVEQVQYLLAHGANPNIKAKNGKRPIDVVPEGNEMLRRMLLFTSHRPHYKK